MSTATFQVGKKQQLFKKAFEYVRLQYVNKKRITDTFFDISGENEKYTLMQFAAKNGKYQFVKQKGMCDF